MWEGYTNSEWKCQTNRKTSRGIDWGSRAYLCFYLVIYFSTEHREIELVLNYKPHPHYHSRCGKVLHALPGEKK